jgi:hypothetical protein
MFDFVTYFLMLANSVHSTLTLLLGVLKLDLSLLWRKFPVVVCPLH